jgi:hypothetical protein
MSSQGIPQVAVVLGSCTAGGAYVPAMAGELKSSSICNCGLVELWHSMLCARHKVATHGATFLHLAPIAISPVYFHSCPCCC